MPGKNFIVFPRPSVIKPELLELNNSSSLLDSLLQVLSLCLRETLLDSRRCTVNEFLSFLQTKATSLLNGLYNLKLCSACLFQDYIERVLLSSSLCTCSSRSGSNSNSCGSWLNTILVLEDLSEFIYFLYGEVHEFLCDSFNICHFYIKI